jgi:hypothetical protein
METTQQKSAAVPFKKRLAKSFLSLIIFLAVMAVFVVPMGLANTLNTMMNTAYRLLMDTALFIMALAVLAGAISAVFSEYGIIELFNHILSPLMKPLYGMPGAAALGIVTTFLSDNPAILTLADDKGYRRFFKDYQVPALTNLGTSFGMGLIVMSFCLGLGNSVPHVTAAVLCGGAGAIAGSILSTRLMLHFTARALGRSKDACDTTEAVSAPTQAATDRGMIRLVNTLLAGGKKGVELGLAVIPGILIICTLVMMLTGGMPDGGYTGSAYEGIGLLPAAANKLHFIIDPLFGFTHPADLAVPVTALGSAGAAMGLISPLVSAGQAGANDIAVFTAMCMCWSGYLCTHVSMMDVLGYSRFTGKAILSHTIGGLFAGVCAHWLFVLVSALLA